MNNFTHAGILLFKHKIHVIISFFYFLKNNATAGKFICRKRQTANDNTH
jgi:hypothetical protein